MLKPKQIALDILVSLIWKYQFIIWDSLSMW